MILSKFDMVSPKTVEEAAALLKEHKNSLVLAGGTDLLIKIRSGSHRPEMVVDIKKIDGLDRIEWEMGHLFIGACADWTQINRNSEIRKHFPALYDASKEFGCFEIRNRATIGGNICNASPGAEAGGPAVVYEAEVMTDGVNGKRKMPVTDFIKGPGRTALEQGEIMTGILLPAPPENSKSAYRRTARVKGQDLATCATTVMAVNPDNPEEREIRVGLSAVLKTPSRSDELEKILSKKKIDKDVLDRAKSWLFNNLHPRASSLRGTPDYKRHVMGGMLEILLEDMGVVE